MFYRTRSIAPRLLPLVLCLAFASAQAEEPPIVPQVEPREVDVPHFPSNDFDFGLFMGTYSTQNFGASKVRGFRLGYAITEDFFVQAAFGQTKVSDEAFRQVLPGGVFEEEQEKLSYYNLSIGYNVLAGEVFIGSKHAKPSALYLIGGVGSTKFVDRKRQTINYGAGFRVYLNDWAALQLDARNHIFTLDILGKQQSTNNLEFTAGATFIF
ncbi:MAG TPA: outer membrane beta-barrel domain-containing protein [Aquabacterium sp.]|uniref:outer membrane beta-barrel domain-containing protein n=1 Tax=Aquabacterium sp. TaxID=1872578 RepID=UPI002E3332F6|nr:outer membrane beta-barrel domain-containing protein [Aquabacterium sp.]HEX5357920.1 outer membrane beta-barrel domain-containing protein [Aquabacterium sp.]